MPHPAPPSLLRAARRAAGLSGRELGARVGMDGTSVTEAEAGRDVRCDTLQRLASALPALDVRALLGRPSEGPRPASLSAWRFHEELFGFSARLLRIETDALAAGRGPLRMSVLGLRALRADLRETPVREALMQAACEGSGAVMRALAAGAEDLAGAPRRVEDEAFVHEFRFPRALRREGLTYVREERAGAVEPSWSEPFAHGLSAWIRFPVERLELVVRRIAGEPPLRLAPSAWPARTAASLEQATETWERLFPGWGGSGGRLRRGSASLIIERPSIAACYGISWEPAGDAELPDAASWTPARPLALQPRPAPLGTVVARARTREHVSRRELARRMDVSPSAVVEIEQGRRRPRLSTLRALLSALPRLAPEELLRPFDADEPASAEEASAWLAALHAARSDCEETIVHVTADGACRYACRMIGLTWLPWGAHDLRLRHGLSATRQGLAAPRLLEVLGDDEEGPTIRIVQRASGALVHEIRFGPGSARRPVSYERRLDAARPLPMTEELSPMYIMAAPLLPTRRLRLELRFPKGLRPRRHVTGCSPEPMLVAREGVEDLRERLHSRGWRVVDDAARGRLALEVDAPMLGVSYAIGLWPWCHARS